MAAENDPKVEGQHSLDEDRRKFLAACGKFAVVTPPALTILLSTSLNSKAVAKSGGGDDSRGGGHYWHHRHRHDGRDYDLFEWLERLLNKFF
ncbi:hypothetical protein AFEL58S_00768 [Afipia felis]